jgi:hypothetical protein
MKKARMCVLAFPDDRILGHPTPVPGVLLFNLDINCSINIQYVDILK